MGNCDGGGKKAAQTQQVTNPSGKMKMAGQAKKTVKMVLCGNASVGKTSITMRYKSGTFQDFHQPTLAGAYQQKKVKAKNGEEIQLNIWDTAGDQRFRSIMPLYYRDAEIALLIFDLTEPETFHQGVSYWLNELEEKVQTSNMIIAIVGNKCDLAAERRVSSQQGTLLANEKKCIYHQTSAKMGTGINELFDKLVQQYLRRKK